METPLHYIKLLDEEKKRLVLVWTSAILFILTLHGYISTIVSTVSNILLLLKFEIAKNFKFSILTYLGIYSKEVFFLKENNYLRDAVGELYAIYI